MSLVSIATYILTQYVVRNFQNKIQQFTIKKKIGRDAWTNTPLLSAHFIFLCSRFFYIILFVFPLHGESEIASECGKKTTGECLRKQRWRFASSLVMNSTANRDACVGPTHFSCQRFRFKFYLRVIIIYSTSVLIYNLK